MVIAETKTYWKQYTIRKFTGTGSVSISLPSEVQVVEYLIVAGGGGGCSSGGGAGGVLNGNLNVKGNVTLTVGAGGAGNNSSGGTHGTDGGPSSFSVISATGGGGGATIGDSGGTTGRSGGSGSGGGAYSAAQTYGGSGISGQGNTGGGNGNYKGSPYPAGGGGGAGQIGGSATSNSQPGKGGDGRVSWITGVPLTYGGGGGGGSYYSGGGSQGGSGGGGAGASSGVGTAGTDGLGGGGGGGANSNQYGGKGGDGVVIIRYLTPFLRSSIVFFPTPPEGGEYAFDPVNVDHERTPGADAFLYEQSLPSTNVNHSRAAAVGVTECEMGPVNVNHARYPVFSWDTVITDPVSEEDGTLIAVTVSRGVDDAMTQAEFQYDGTTIGGIFGNDYMTKIQVQIPDYNGVSRVVFVGIAPSSRAHYEPAKDKMVLTAVDYGLYLTKNPLEDKDLALLPPANQINEGTNYMKVLYYDYVVHPFQIGQHVVGAVSGATGTVFELVQTTLTHMVLYPATGKFLDDEALMVGGVQYAQADGHSMDAPYVPTYTTIYPEDWVRSVLGGANWMRVTGIEPYQIISSGGYWDTATCPAVPFMFGSKESIFDAMKRLAKYMKYIMLIKPRDIGGGNYRPALYWVPLSSIDDSSNGLDLPAAATITGPNDAFLTSPFELEQNGDNQVDRIKLMCQDLYGNWLTSAKGTNYANAGEGPVRTFYDEPQDICTQTDLDALRDDLYDLFTPRGMVWHCTLAERSDLELYQLLTISGYASKIPDGTYRIIRIAYERGCPQNLTHVTFMLASAFSTLLKRGMTYTDSINEIQRIINHQETLKSQTELGTCTITDGITVTYETEAGNPGRGRDGTAVGVTPGTIIVGSKIIIHSTRGGTICLPVVGEAATNTNLSTVDEPTIISALRDESDHNYWFLKWTPGANNTGVSVNVQTGSYPTAPGSVSGAGYTFARYTASVIQMRIRFYGPSITYYVKIWGERNGAYSAAGDTTTIVSGADVTPGDEEPEPIGVIDQFLASGLGHGPSEFPVPHSYVVFNAVLPFGYNGTDNIYIGGPSVNVPDWFWWVSANGNFFTDDIMTIYGPKGSLPVAGAGWHEPINIKNLLKIGSNTIRIEITDTVGGYYGCSDLYIRTFFGA